MSSYLYHILTSCCPKQRVNSILKYAVMCQFSIDIETSRRIVRIPRLLLKKLMGYRKGV